MFALLISNYYTVNDSFSFGKQTIILSCLIVVEWGIILQILRFLHSNIF